ncbi:MAG TPA: cache domain-containing protein [Nitrososphaeraceae archaeon]|nr:cache domain-containing protein [Nitrososphaeraceae archaeon]
MTITSPDCINALTNNTSISSNNSIITITTATVARNNLITNSLAMNLENHLLKAGAILNITSKLPQVRNVPYAPLLNQTLKTLHGIPQYADIEKRQVAKNIISGNSDLYEIFFMIPNGDMYLLEPYSIQQILTENNYAFRDYFQGAIKTNDTYLGNVIVSTAASGNREAVIAVPVYSSLKDKSTTTTGVWAGGIDFKVFDKELQLLKLTSGERVVYTGYNGQKVADSDINRGKTPESFANLNSFKNAISGQSGSTVDTVDNKKTLVTYQPVNAFHNTWVVLLMQPLLQK